MQQIDLSSHETPKSVSSKKKLNPVEHQKQQQKLQRELIKAQKQKDKANRQEEEETQKRLFKEERLHSGANSRRARQDARKEKKRTERTECGQQPCEHGIIKCRCDLNQYGHRMINISERPKLKEVLHHLIYLHSDSLCPPNAKDTQSCRPASLASFVSRLLALQARRFRYRSLNRVAGDSHCGGTAVAAA